MLLVVQGCLLLLQNGAFYRGARLISATQAKEDEEAVVTSSPQSAAGTTAQPWYGLEPPFCSFLAPRA